MQGRAPEAARLSLAAALAILGALASACASTSVPRPYTPASMGTRVADASAAEAVPTAPRSVEMSRAIIDTAMSLRGVRYRAGGANPGGFDCSGFTMYVFGRHGIDLPRSASDQYHEGRSINRKDIAAGDLLFFKTVGKEVTHVAISIGGDRFVHAPSSSGAVRVEVLESPYWSPRFIGARRL